MVTRAAASTLSLACLIMLAGSPGASAAPWPSAPNPYGDERGTAIVEIGADGSQQVLITQDQEMRYPYDLGLGGAQSDGFRLPDDPDAVLPPYLRIDVQPESFLVDGQPVAANGYSVYQHRIVMSHKIEDAAAGWHRAELRYRIPAAGVAEQDGEGEPVDDRWTAYFRPLADSTPEFRSEATITGVECMTIPPQTEPCGVRTETGWIIDPDFELPYGEYELEPTYLVRMQSPTEDLVEPVIDRG